MVRILSVVHPTSHMDANRIKLIRNLIMTDGTQLFCCCLFGVNKIVHDIVLYLIIRQEPVRPPVIAIGAKRQSN